MRAFLTVLAATFAAAPAWAVVFTSPPGTTIITSLPSTQPASNTTAQLDTNHDGYITQEEYIAPCLQHFSMIDTNHDGRIDAQEATAYNASIGQATGTATVQQPAAVKSTTTTTTTHRASTATAPGGNVIVMPGLIKTPNVTITPNGIVTPDTIVSPAGVFTPGTTVTPNGIVTHDDGQ